LPSMDCKHPLKAIIVYCLLKIIQYNAFVLTKLLLLRLLPNSSFWGRQLS
jgi:hypothetical protein